MLKKEEQQFSVTIVTENMLSAKEVSLALRELKIFAYHFHNLDEYWASTHIQVPDLTIIDISKISQGDLSFSSHPLVRTGKLNFCFFYKEDSEKLVKSLQKFEPIALINLDSTLSFNLKQIISFLKTEKKNNDEIKELTERLERLKKRSHKIVSERSEAEEFKAQVTQVQNLSDSIKQRMVKSDFQTALIENFSEWVDITDFGIYELSRDGQRLISPEFKAKKYFPLPSLFLGNKPQEGIALFAKEMAGQVVFDLFERAPITLEIKGGRTELLLYISYEAEFLKSFPWELLESEISRLYQQFKILNQAPKLAGQFLPMWEALDYMDKLGEDREMRVKVLVLDLSPLLKVASGKISNKFYWSTFYNEFFMQISSLISPSTKLSVQGPWEITFFVEDEKLEKDSFALQSFIKKFSYWRFFQDQSSVLPDDIHPTLRISPANSSLYLKGFENKYQMNEPQETAVRGRQHSQLTV